MAATCMSLPARGGDGPCRSAGSPVPPPAGSSLVSLLLCSGPLEGRKPAALRPLASPPRRASWACRSPLCHLFGVSAGTPLFLVTRTHARPAVQTSLRQHRPPQALPLVVPGTHSPGKGSGSQGPGHNLAAGPWETNLLSPGSGFPISEGRAGWDAGFALPCTPPIGNELGFCTPLS